VIYFLVYAGLLLCGFISRGSASQRNALYYVCLVGLFFFVGFRYRVGCDWQGYLNIFELVRHSEAPLNNTEIGFWAVNRLLHDFGLEYPYINVIASGAFFLGLNSLARRQPDPLAVLILAFPILILNLAMSGIRQAIAFGFLCYAFGAFVERHLVRYILFVAIAYTFHTSAALFFMLAPLVRGEYTRRRVALAGLIALPGLYYILSSESFEIYVKRYLGTAIEAAGAPFRAGLIALTGVLFLWLLDRKWSKWYVRDYKLVKVSSYLMLAVFPVALLTSVGGDRFGYYLASIQLVVLARLPFLLNGSYRNLVAIAPYVVFGATLLTWTWLSWLFEKCYVPYQAWW